jgi:hypothetical protein
MPNEERKMQNAEFRSARRKKEKRRMQNAFDANKNKRNNIKLMITEHNAEPHAAVAALRRNSDPSIENQDGRPAWTAGPAWSGKPARSLLPLLGERARVRGTAILANPNCTTQSNPVPMALP